MRVNQGHVADIISYCQHNSNNHYLYHVENHKGKFIIYGMDEPQKTYLAMAQVFDDNFTRVWRNQNWVEFLRLLTLYANRDDFYPEMNDKTLDPRVSNYHVHFDRELTSIEGNDNQYELVRNVHKVWDTGREQTRQQFTQSFKASPFAIKRTDHASQMKGIQKNKGWATSKVIGNNREQIKGGLLKFAVRRACKHLMYKTISDGHSVVYCLDQINLSAVANKKWAYKEKDVVNPDIIWLDQDQAEEAENSAIDKVPVCTSEIREIFRYWDFFSQRNDDGYSKVTFMKDFKQVSPPWVHSDSKQWAAYAIRLLVKYTSQMPQWKDYLLQVQSLYTQGAYQQVIHQYHVSQIGITQVHRRKVAPNH